jgi:hypothetical protein
LRNLVECRAAHQPKVRTVAFERRGWAEPRHALTSDLPAVSSCLLPNSTLSRERGLGSRYFDPI